MAWSIPEPYGADFTSSGCRSRSQADEEVLVISLKVEVGDEMLANRKREKDLRGEAYSEGGKWDEEWKGLVVKRDDPGAGQVFPTAVKRQIYNV
jgi:hypothetical protein